MNIVSKLLIPPKLPDAWDSSIKTHQPKFFQFEEKLYFIIVMGSLSTLIFGLGKQADLSIIALVAATTAYFGYRYLMSRMLSPLEFAWATSLAMNCGIPELPRHARRAELVHLMDKVGELSARETNPPIRSRN